MAEKNLDIDKTLFELTEQYPDLIDVCCGSDLIGHFA